MSDKFNGGSPRGPGPNLTNTVAFPVSAELGIRTLAEMIPLAEFLEIFLHKKQGFLVLVVHHRQLIPS